MVRLSCFLKSGQKVKINKSTLGIELEVCYLIKKQFFTSKGKITMKNISKYITHMAPCIEVVGYRQKKKGLKSFGDLASDFGANVKFLIGKKKKYKKIKRKGTFLRFGLCKKFFKKWQTC